MDTLSRMPDNFLDCIIADPPYGISFQSAWRTAPERFEKIINDEKPYIEWIELASTKLKQGGRMIMFYRYDVQEDFFIEIKKHGLEIKSQIIWDKVIHGLGDLNAQFAPQHELIVYATKGRYEFKNGRPKTVIKSVRVDATLQVHPCEKPVHLMRSLILSTTSEGDIVYDPFSGSANTSVAAHIEKRKFIASEINEPYFINGMKRIKDIRSQTTIFDQ